MKRHTLALAALLGTAASTSYAQSSVTLYGIIDTGVEYVSHANAAGDRLVRMPAVTGELPSRWGLRGTEDLGGGLKALFTLESGFNVRDGSAGQGGRLFGRQAWVGLGSNWGTLSFGRQYNASYWAAFDADLLGPDIFALGSLDAYIPNGRTDNNVVYKGVFSGLTVFGSYSFGRDAAGTGNSPGQGTCAGQVPGRSRDCRQWSTMLKYDTDAFGVAAAYDEQHGGTGAAANFFDGVAPVALTSGADKDVRMQLNGYVKYGTVRLGAGWVGRHVETDSPALPDARSNLWFLGASWQATPSFLLDSEVYRITNKDHDTRATLATVRSTYFFSKRTAVYLQGAYLGNSTRAAYSVSSGGGGSTPAPGMNQVGVMAGVRQLF